MPVSIDRSEPVKSGLTSSGISVRFASRTSRSRLADPSGGV